MDVVEIPFAPSESIRKGGNEIATTSEFPVFESSIVSIDLKLQIGFAWVASRFEHIFKGVVGIVFGLTAILEQLAIKSYVKLKVSAKRFGGMLDSMVSDVDSLRVNDAGKVCSISGCNCKDCCATHGMQCGVLRYDCHCRYHRRNEGEAEAERGEALRWDGVHRGPSLRSG
jgi:hypothetical protein